MPNAKERAGPPAEQLSLTAGENARLQAELRLALEQQHATAEILRILSGPAGDMPAVFQTIVENALSLCHADNATLALFEHKRARVMANAGRFTDEAAYTAFWDDIPLRPERGSITGRVLMDKAPVHIPDIEEDREGIRRTTVRATGSRSILAVPLKVGDSVVGMLVVRRKQPGPFAEGAVRLLSTFADQAVIAIENLRLFATVKRQSEELSRYVSPQVADLITSDEGSRMLEGHRRHITVIFCDVRGFTSFSQTTEPEEVLSVVRQYHGAMGELIMTHGGTLEHFAGDGMMVFFNDPVPMNEHERAAVSLGIAMRDRFAELSANWRRKGYDLGVGIGIATGFATLGRIGFEGRYDYGAVGNVVIIASRLSTQAEKGQILISQRVMAAVESRVEATPIGAVTLKGMERPVAAYSVVSVN